MHPFSYTYLVTRDFIGQGRNTEIVKTSSTEDKADDVIVNNLKGNQ